MEVVEDNLLLEDQLEVVGNTAVSKELLVNMVNKASIRAQVNMEINKLHLESVDLYLEVVRVQ